MIILAWINEKSTSLKYNDEKSIALMTSSNRGSGFTLEGVYVNT